MGILSSVADERVFTSPQANYDLFIPALDEITIEACNEAFRAAWAAEHRVITVIGNTGTEHPADPAAHIRELYAAAHAVPLAAPPAIEDAAFAYTDFGPPGEIYHREYVEDLDITLVEFANRVRLNIKKTDFSAQSISMSVRLGTGQPLYIQQFVPIGLTVTMVITAFLHLGVVIGLFQALTSVQEMTLTFVPKAGAMIAVFWLSMSFMTGTLVTFFTETLIPMIAGV